jgi:ankyrin repeat protein
VDDVRNSLEKGAKIDQTDGTGWTALHWAAASNSRVEVLKYLVECGAKVNAEDRMGWTPLHHATASNGNVEVLKWLIECGADIGAKNRSGQTPSDLATHVTKKRILEEAKRKKVKTPLAL